MIKVKSNKELFDDLQTLSYRSMTWAGIVQNDMELTSEDVTELVKMMNEHIEQFKLYKVKILEHISKCNKE